MSIPPRLPVLRTACSRASTSSSLLLSNPLQCRCFSTSEPLQGRKKTARNNELRGMSAMKGTGVAPWIKLSVTTKDLKKPRKIEPMPVLESQDHGLWGFFNRDRSLLTPPNTEFDYGRAWTVHELRTKSFEDLHTLWWICVRERNRISTEMITRKMLQAGYGEVEAKKRMEEVYKTMKAIKFTLTERFYAWESALKLARTDPDVVVDRQDVIFEPSQETLERRDIDISFKESDRLPFLEESEESPEAQQIKILKERLKSTIS